MSNLAVNIDQVVYESDSKKKLQNISRFINIVMLDNLDGKVKAKKMLTNNNAVCNKAEAKLLLAIVSKKIGEFAVSGDSSIAIGVAVIIFIM